MSKFYQHYGTRTTPQSQPIPGSTQVENSAGGFAYPVDDWTRLDRFLILGSEGGSYYIGEPKLTVENAEAARRCIAADGPRVVARLVEISDAGRAPKNDPALFVLAMCLGLGNDATKREATLAFPKVVRIGTHLFHIAEYSKQFRGRGRVWRRAFSNWYEEMAEGRLALQLVKYKQRDGWTHRDVMRLCHPKADTQPRNALFSYAVGKSTEGQAQALFGLIEYAERAAAAESPGEVAALVHEVGLPRECVPTQFLDSPKVWEALLQGMPATALVRNLGKMSSIGLVSMGSEAEKLAAQKLCDVEYLRRGRVHPISLLSAMKVYASGQGVRGSLTWHPSRRVMDALDDAFYASFGLLEPAGKRILIALDVSGSMGCNVNGLPHLSAREAAAAMAMIVAKTEKDWEICGFTSGAMRSTYSRNGEMSGFIPLDISPRQRLDDVVNKTAGLPFGGTDCALPMVWAEQNKRAFDAFYVITDNETWAGSIHPTQALRSYREKMGIPAKLAVWGMASNGFSIADPADGGMLDIAGVDAAAPSIVADFTRS